MIKEELKVRWVEKNNDWIFNSHSKYGLIVIRKVYKNELLQH